MAENEMTLAELWGLIQTSNQETRREISEELREVRSSLASFVTKEQWAAEKAMLELRVERLEFELAEQDRKQAELERRIREERDAEVARKEAERERKEAEELAARERREERKLNLWFKVVIPMLAVILPILVGLWSPMAK